MAPAYCARPTHLILPAETPTAPASSALPILGGWLRSGRMANRYCRVSIEGRLSSTFDSLHSAFQSSWLAIVEQYCSDCASGPEDTFTDLSPVVVMAAMFISLTMFSLSDK